MKKRLVSSNDLSSFIKMVVYGHFKDRHTWSSADVDICHAYAHSEGMKPQFRISGGWPFFFFCSAIFRTQALAVRANKYSQEATLDCS